ncbi:electroneutral sodium bicarbonate exchanger 1 isoform 2 [Rattus norvegicus]|uniref:Isoform 3 of Electroneutral sodium bicarbonate exchanger 1 n=1 Tax=Rattus norvegicus TaxID=10116 RepID=Q6RVG2-3|nr:electroneutral sodium bicarbonate exchanger 1 isoform 2 [Rattus norvegicus]AAR37053.1 Na-driven Cl-HCO3 exchanger NDCBE1-A [Rattus norvegicus]|eukprot:NP_001257723.1 electroneutral sodium bicarbonate exchanger 1 isoform 2 [Rattus norvegicus]
MPAGSNEPDGVLSYQRPDEEAVVDQGGTSTILNIHYEKEELEGHRTLYVGVRMPLGRQSHRHHRTHGQKHRRRGGRGKGASQGEEGLEASAHDTPSQRVQFILGTEEDEEHVPHELFTELDEICMKEGEEAEWKETARWLKFEEDVEDGGERWSKPYVATLSLHSLFELRSCLINGSVLLDMRASSIEEISDLILDQQELLRDLSDSVRVKVREALLKKHHHQNEKKRNNLIPIVRSFAEVGKKQSDPHSMDRDGQTVSPQSAPATNLEVKNGVNCEHSPVDLSKADLHFMKKIPAGAEASNVLVGEVDTLDRPIVAFVRLSPAVLLSGLTEVPIPTRFLFILLGPVGKGQQYHEIGRSMATIMTDEIFHDVAYKAKERDDLLAGIDEFLDQVTVLPPGEWDPSIRIEPPKNVPSQEKRKMPGVPNGNICHVEPEPHGGHSGPELERTGRLFGGLVLDVKRKAPWYWSDYRDALSLQCLASFLFLYCACMSPVITFGGLLGEATEGRISAIESLFGASMTGIAYSLFAGQPLTILGSTGPVLVFEKILFKFCKDYALSYLSLRACIGLWTAFLCIVLVATDASSLVCYITRFTEEAFASLICIIFIYEAIEKLIHLAETYPIHMHSQLDHLSLYYCRCALPENPNNHTLQYWKEHSIPTADVNWANLTVSVRSTVSDFAVFLTIFTMVILDFLIGVPSPKLQVPSVFKPTRDDRGWFISPIGPNPWWTVIAAIIPALLCTILIFMDQQITAVIINRKEHKLKKGCGYHLDLLVVAIMLGVCSLMGLPWFVAATVLSITHVNSLKLESECSAPGEQPKFLGIREQRVTGLMIFVLMGCSVFMTAVLKFIPMPVLYGVFLYMGVSSLQGIQFFDRLKLFGMPAKHQPDFIYLRHVPLRKVHLFTLVQLTCLVLLWVIKASPAAIVFPMMVLALVFVRKVMDLCFSKRELSWLDDLMPESKKKKLDDAKKKEEEEAEKMLDIGGDKFPLESRKLLSSPGKNNSFRCDPSEINISDEMPKTTVWKALSINSGNTKEKSPFN